MAVSVELIVERSYGLRLPRNSLKGLEANISLLKKPLGNQGFFLLLVYHISMKAIRVRKSILFTKSRPHKIKSKVIHRKMKYKEILKK